MKVRFAAVLTLAFLAVFCRDPEKKDPSKAGFLVVNRQVGNSEKTVSPDGGTFTIPVTCDANWTALAEDGLSWLSLGERVKDGKKSWSLPVTVEPNEGEYPRSGSITFKADKYISSVTIVQPAPDPVTLNKIAGFYGVEGGDVPLNGLRQSSSFHSGGTWAFRVLEPSALAVYALGGIPEELSSGDVIPSLSYKVLRQGMVEHLETFRQVKVVRSTPTMVWLRLNDTVYFVVER
ncbi:MAG: BACON domain-containing protein [Bacteroidales bacterium]|nr:BACON domain-containing protein [Bacteroidales bacterium]